VIATHLRSETATVTPSARDSPSLRLCPAWSFQCRAALYARLDGRLHQKTRFFGAAFLTNRVLGYLASVRRGLPISEETCHWLAGMGELLEAANLNMAAALDTVCLAGRSLDASIVSHEQSTVEIALRKTRTAQPRLYSKVSSELDTLLNAGSWPALFRLSPTVNRYCQVLSAVRQQLAGPIEFAAQQHRETIGMALIASLPQGKRLKVGREHWPAQAARPHGRVVLTGTNRPDSCPPGGGGYPRGKEEPI
jgi:hypothetical protein